MAFYYLILENLRENIDDVMAVYVSDWHAQGAQIKYHFWVCLWGCSQLRLAFEPVDSVRPPQCGWYHLICQDMDGGIPTFLFSQPYSFSSDISSHFLLGLEFTPLAQLVLRPLNLGWIIPLAFSGYPVSRLWNFSVSITPWTISS